jgi:hypothetical protein
LLDDSNWDFVKIGHKHLTDYLASDAAREKAAQGTNH